MTTDNLALAKEMLANSHEDWLVAHKRLMVGLLQAVDHRQQNDLEAFAKVVAEFNEYARATNAPPNVCLLLSDMLGDLANRAEGRPSQTPKPQRTKQSPRTSVQKEMLWAATSVWIDERNGTDQAHIDAERKLLSAGCPLPTNPTHGTQQPGLSIKNWRKQSGSGRRSKVAEPFFKANRDLVDRLVAGRDRSREEASELMFDAAIKTLVNARS